MRATASSLLIAISLCLSAAIPTSGQQLKEWTWKDRDGKVRSRADLDEILRQHQLWLASHSKSGAPANLRDANLRVADLVGAKLTGADLSGADLTRAHLSNAVLSPTNLSGANLYYVDLSGANLVVADVSGAALYEADLGGAILVGAHLRDAHLDGVYLCGADVNSANLSRAHLNGADLSDAQLLGGYLCGADLSGADLSGAKLDGTHVDRVLFGPENLPKLDGMAQTQGLELMRYENKPGPLTQLRKQFLDAGYREQERAVTCALNRHNATPAELRASLGEKWKSIRGEKFESNRILSFGSFLEGAFKWVAFDLTCQYGLKSGTASKDCSMALAVLLARLRNLHASAGDIGYLSRRHPVVAGKIQHSGDTNPARSNPRNKMVEAPLSLAAAGVARAARRHVLQPDVGLQHRLS
jgi:uncharacterized protein YjbI with pentapeptide repeats